MAYQLPDWEESFQEKLAAIDASKRDNPGALLPIIPNREKWDEFSFAVRSEWNVWKRDLDRYPACLIVLYGGLAFFEYDESTFWPYFASLVGSPSIPANQQAELNNSFLRASERHGLRIVSRTIRRTPHFYVSVAVSQIGIPLSLWDGFLEICDWASWLDNWEVFTDEEWAQAIAKRTGSRTRLKNFLIENRNTSTSLIRELLDARTILTANPEWTVTELSKACFLRAEYFEEVPETAEFLLPTNPEFLIRDRAQLNWDEQRGRIRLYLPSIHQNKLPATWCLENLRQPASASPDELILNSLAFQSTLSLKLIGANATDSQRLRGISPWGLFDLDNNGRLVNPDREYLPLHSYVLVSPAQLPNITRDGFEEMECPSNTRFEFNDGTQCFVTYLWPTGKFAELRLGDHGNPAIIRFRPSSKIEARFFVGTGSHAANFSRLPHDEVKIEDWPILCLAIPRGYYKDNQVVLSDKFRVFIDRKLAFGKWEAREVHLDDGKDFYVWNWSKRPLNYEKTKSGTAKSFKQLTDFYRPPVSHGKMILSIQASGFSEQYQIYKDDPKAGMEKCWSKLPGAFLPWFLLCQTQEGMKWDDLLFACDIIAPSLRLSPYLLRKYEKDGFFVQKGVLWKIAESRATLADVENEQCQLDYCGDPSLLWRLYRWMSRPGISLPDVAVINKRGELPYLRMIWDAHRNDEIIYRLQHMNVHIGSSLWNH